MSSHLTRLQRFGLPALCLAAFLAAFSTEVRAQTPPADGLTMNRRSFDLPFYLAASEVPRVREVLLYVKPDQGGDWRLHATAVPSQMRYDGRTGNQVGGFDIRLDRDGTFLFAIMTVYVDGHSEHRSIDDLHEDRRITVSTRQPDIALTPLPVKDAPDGQSVIVGVEWRIDETNLARSSIRLEGRWYGAPQWSNFSRGFTPETTGKQSWTIPAGKRMEVRIIATDRAGNQANRSVVLGSGVGAMTSGGGTGNSLSRDATPGSGQPAFRLINSPTITLQYRLGDRPQSGIHHIDLYVTRVGNDWKKVEQQNPLPVDKNSDMAEVQYNATEDGTYGFMMIAVSKAGIASQSPPQSNDPPQIWVEVDTKKPDAELLTVRLSKPTDPRTLVLEWKAQDKNLTAAPIIFEYAEVSDGQSGELKWQELTAPPALANTGRYVCATPQLSPNVYEFKVRMTVFDKAGNWNTVPYDKTICVDVARPRIDIIDVKPPTPKKGP